MPSIFLASHHHAPHLPSINIIRSIQQSAALALGRLANYSDDLAEAVVQNEILPQLVYSLSEQNRFYKQAAAFCLRAVAKHSPELAQAVIDSGSLDSLVTCLEEFDPGVKEAAAWTMGYIAGHNAELSQQARFSGLDGHARAPLAFYCSQELCYQSSAAHCLWPRELMVWNKMPCACSYLRAWSRTHLHCCAERGLVFHMHTCAR